MDITINSLLLGLYVKALHVYSKTYARNDVNKDTELLDDKQHELMLEAARYSVLFSALLLFNLLGIIVTIFLFAMLSIRNKSHHIDNYDTLNLIGQCILIFFQFGKEVILLIAIQLSFIFSHVPYEKLCNRCDKWVKKYCQDLVRKRSGRQNVGIEREYDLKESLLPQHQL